MTTIYAINKTTAAGTRNWMGKVIGKYATEGEMMDELTEYGEMAKGDGYTVEFLTEYSFVARSGRDTAVYVAYSYTADSRIQASGEPKFCDPVAAILARQS